MPFPVTGTTPPDWWRSAVIYQVYPRSFADSDGDGVGDLPGVTSRLEHLRDLGVDGVWLSPFYVSPMADAGYDVADHRDVDPLFGTLDDARTLIDTAHRLGLRVILDLVPNHTSDAHPWFRAALAAGPGAPERDRYLFRDGGGPAGDQPPNNWLSVFGGPAWQRVTEADGSPGQWYLHLFDARQPDLNWAHPQVRAEFEDILRFWLDHGVDGFRVDVAHGLVKAAGLPDAPDPTVRLLHAGEREPAWDQDGVHEIYRRWRAILAGYRDRPGPGGEPVMVAEAWVDPAERLARYLRPDEFHQGFNFDFLRTPWRAPDLRAAIRRSLQATAVVGAPTTWVLSNHDVVRHTTRLALPVGSPPPNGIGPGDPQPDQGLGLRRGRAATLLMLALPGSAYLYQGEELGLPEHTTLPDEIRTDPAFARSGGREPGRDGCRVPLPWDSTRPGLGFSPTGRTWLPQPPVFTALAVDRQREDPASTLAMYRTALRVRREHGLGTGQVQWPDEHPEAVVTFRTGDLVVAVNLGPPVPLPTGRVLVRSGAARNGLLGTDEAAWIEP